MKFRLILALSISILAIGGATVSRLASAKKPSPGIVAVEPSAESLKTNENLVIDADIAASNVSTSTKPLTNTDLLGQQLILGYVDLASKGKATDASIAALAAQYVDIIPTLNTATVVSLYDIVTTSNSKADFEQYAATLTKIHEEYGQKLSKAYGGGKNLTSAGTDLYNFAKAFNVIYTDTATKLRKLPTPPLVVAAHLKLINHYLIGASAMKAIANTDNDASTAFAGIIALNSSIEEETTIYDEISKILTAHGL